MSHPHVPPPDSAAQMPAGFQPLVPFHGKMLQRLLDQRKVDQLGAIGWAGPLEGLGISLAPALVWEPLLRRGLVEDLTQTELGAGGRFFCRITDLGVVCLHLGIMPIQDRIVLTVAAVKKMAIEHGLTSK